MVLKGRADRRWNNSAPSFFPLPPSPLPFPKPPSPPNLPRNGPHLQAVLSLQNNLPADGGTLIVPSFHKSFAPWVKSLGPVVGHLACSGASKGETGNWLVPREGGGGSYKFTSSDPIHKLARRVPLREGSMLVWDQRVVHGSAPNDSGNSRTAQFVKAFLRNKVSGGRVERRGRIVERELERAGTKGVVTELGRRVFGLDGGGRGEGG